jgi:hypothetical protein
VTTHPARRLWSVLEPLHDVLYFDPRVKEAGVRLGLKGFWDTYFAFRAAPLGAATAGTVEATFANFAPRMVQLAVPSCWTRATPESCLVTRIAVCAESLRALGADPAACERAAAVLEPAVASADPTGRPLFAANAGLPPSSDPVEALWQTATTLREHRGDGHVAALVAHGVSGLQAHVLQAARGRLSPEMVRRARGWEEQEWDAATEALRARRLVGAEGLTPEGKELVEAIEERTDQLAWDGALAAVGEGAVDELVALLGSPADAVHASGLIPQPNPMGLAPRG